MSRLALLVGAVPQRCIEGPIVRLLPGTWTLHVQGMVDSDLTLLVQGRPACGLKDKMQVIIEQACDVMLDFHRRGTEPFINVFAEKQ